VSKHPQNTDVNQHTPQQRFTGYWIPVELSALELSRSEEFLLSLIDSLEADAPNYCFASNEYLAKHMRISLSRVSFYITRLKRLGLIEQVSFDGKRRTLRVLKENWYKRPREFSKKESCVKTRTLEKSNEIQKQTSACFHAGRLRENTQSLIIYNKEDSSVCVNSPPVAVPSPLETPKAKAKLINFQGKEFEVSLEDIFSSCVMQKRDWTKKEIELAWKILSDYNSPIRDWFLFIDGTIKNIRKINKIKELKGQKECKVKQKNLNNRSENIKSEHLTRGTPTLPLANWRSRLAQEKKSTNT